MKAKKIIIIAVVVVAFAVGLDFLGRHLIESGVPPFISSKLSELMDDKVLMDSIGGSGHFEFKFNEHDYELRDTVRYSIKITGKEKVLLYNGVQLRVDKEKWQLLNESLTIE